MNYYIRQYMICDEDSRLSIVFNDAGGVLREQEITLDDGSDKWVLVD